MSSRSERRRPAGSPGLIARHLYKVYGLTVESEVELPELVSAEGCEPDVRIRFGEVPETLENTVCRWSWCMASNHEVLLTIKDVAKYLISDGEQITIDRRVGVADGPPVADIRLWLLGSAFAALLHQRGNLPLHVSAVNSPSGVWAFTGESGEGKSTLAGFLHRRFGWELVSDDVSVLDSEGEEPVIHPGPRKLKLWADALEKLDFKECASVRDLSNTEKFQLYLAGDSAYRPEALRALVLLESAADGAESSVEPLFGIEAFDACLGAVYRPYMENWFKVPEQRMKDVARLCRQIKVYRFRRPRSLKDFERNMEPLLELLNGKKP